MKNTMIGALVGIVLAWAALNHGIGGFLLMALFMGVGALIGRLLDGRIDVRSLRDAFTGRRSSS
ncbi:DUF2273 domain-containing protein [Paeniglutamicibacter cryotolerans]|uniref:Putative membrane protein n=1 Tax=Paeniglutamicibacter cryotolerans TaxID=670079 RepID=A0A839QH70_9MICC|nr:DUF2273 domain-containing protein [Paeniglutamicibacter cryotolerans]MBB2995087.1 putative membrane protein [Paeniglutamicibacter cryotolerans]